MSCKLNEEKLLCHIVLDDVYAQKLSCRAGTAFFRAFIVQNRSTGIISMKYRFRYRNPDERNWYVVEPKQQGPNTMAKLRDSIAKVLSISATTQSGGGPPPPLYFFYPPDDDGDPAKTLLWMKQQDLIEITAVEERP
jgi:hypothetical protein